LIFLSACTTTQTLVVRPEVLHFDTPETSGAFLKGNVAISVGPRPKYEFGTASTSDFLGDTSSANTSERFKSDASMGFNLNVGLLERIDVFLRADNVLGLKAQLIGAPLAKLEPGWKLTVSGASAKYAYVQTEKDFYVYGSDDPVGLSMKGKSSDYTINTGYRFNPQFLTYVNVFKNDTTAQGIFDTKTIKLSKNRTQSTKGILLGINFIQESKSSFFTLEIGYAKSTWSTLGTKTYTPAGASIGYIW